MRSPADLRAFLDINRVGTCIFCDGLQMFETCVDLNNACYAAINPAPGRPVALVMAPIRDLLPRQHRHAPAPDREHHLPRVEALAPTRAERRLGHDGKQEAARLQGLHFEGSQSSLWRRHKPKPPVAPSKCITRPHPITCGTRQEVPAHPVDRLLPPRAQIRRVRHAVTVDADGRDDGRIRSLRARRFVWQGLYLRKQRDVNRRAKPFDIETPRRVRGHCPEHLGGWTNFAPSDPAHLQVLATPLRRGGTW